MAGPSHLIQIAAVALVREHYADFGPIFAAEEPRTGTG
jgi:hypothetical protein